MNTESVVAVFYDNDKAYDMMWTVFIIKVGKITGITGQLYTWRKEFLYRRQKEGNTCSVEHGVESVLYY